MKEIIIAFDIDGTIYGSPFAHKGEPVLNLKTIQLMQLLKEHIKNVKIVVWSGGGRSYAEQIVNKFGLEKWVDECASKQEYIYEPQIAFDDEYDFNMATVNLIVNTKS